MVTFEGSGAYPVTLRNTLAAQPTTNTGPSLSSPRAPNTVPAVLNTADPARTTRDQTNAAARASSSMAENIAKKDADSDIFTTEIPMIGNMTDAEAEALQRAQQKALVPLSFIEKIAVVSAVGPEEAAGTATPKGRDDGVATDGPRLDIRR